jgi:hypothetical protein
VTYAELVSLAIAQVLLRYDDERRWLRAARKQVGHLFPRLLAQSEYNQRLKNTAPLLEAALRWLAACTPATAELVRLLDATPIPCGQSAVTAKRSDLFGWAGYGYCPSHSRWYWGAKLMLMCTCEGTVTGFGLANPKLHGERDQARQMLQGNPANRPAPGADPPSPQRRKGAPVFPELAAATRRGDHLDTEKPARPGTPRRPGPGRAVGPDRAATARAQRRHLVQLANRRTGQAIPDRL